MSNLGNYPSNYLIYNEEVTKNLNVVVQIEGVPQLITFVPIFKRIRYGDPDIHYGDAGLVYGGLVQYKSSAFMSILSLDSNLIISQTVEPEQGKGSVSTLTLVLIDKDSFVTNLVTPGNVVDELMGNKLVTIKIGYQQTSYPEDYFTAFRGYVSSIQYTPGKYYLQLSDATSKQRAQVFYSGTTEVTSDVAPTDTTINTVSTVDFFQPILGPNGQYDPAITPYIIVNSEVIQYPNDNTGLGSTSFNFLTRGARGTIAATAAIGDAVAASIQIQDNGIDMALKIMLSGWNGPWLTGQPVLSIQNTMSVGNLPNGMLFPVGVDVSDQYGLTVGDYITVSGSTAGNDGTYVIQTIEDLNDGTNNFIRTTTPFPNPEFPATTVQLAFRSQYDTYPVLCGLMMKPTEVDVAQFQQIKNFFFYQAEYTYQFYITDREDGKSFIEDEIIFPFGCYAITRYGRLSITVTKPPIANEKLPVLDQTSVLQPNNISVERSVNNRKYFNEIQYRFDVLDDGSTFTNVQAIIDTESLSNVDISSVLPIESKGLRSSLNAQKVINRQGTFLINRYKTGAILIKMKTNWRVGSIIETGDTVLITDQGGLQIANMTTGVRDLGQQLFEVIGRSYDIKNGSVDLQLLGNLNYLVSDRFCTISPSSMIQPGSTTTRIQINDSFGGLYPQEEYKKYSNLNGAGLRIHTRDYTTFNETTNLVGFDSVNKNIMIISPALSVAPPAGYIVDIIEYPNTVHKFDQAILKLLYDFVDPSVAVVSGISATQFTVSSGDALLFQLKLTVLVHNIDYSVLSTEVLVTDISGTTITVSPGFGFTPDNTMTVELIGFPDGGGPYRIL